MLVSRCDAVEIFDAADATRRRVSVGCAPSKDHPRVLAVCIHRIKFAGGRRKVIGTERERERHEQPLVVRPDESMHLVGWVEFHDARDVESIERQHDQDLLAIATQ